MASAFNLTAQLNLRGPSNIRQIVSDVKKQLGTISADVKFKIDPSSINNTSKLSRSLQELNKNLSNVAGNAKAASDAIRNFGSSISSISSSSSKLSSNLSKVDSSSKSLGTTVSKTAKSIGVARTEMEEFGRQSALAIRRFAAFSAVTGVFFSLNRAINSGLKNFIEFDRQLVRLQQVTGKSAEGLRGIQDEITKLSISLGVSSDSLVSVSATLAQAGLSAKETQVALRALALTELAPSFDNINQTVEGSIALMRQFSIGAKDLEKALGSVNSVAAAFAVESSDIIAAIQRTGGVFASASKGVSEGTDALNEFIAVFTSVRQTTRESAETIATGLRTIFTRIQRGGTIEALREYGITLTDVEGKFVGAYKAIELLSQGLSRLDPRDLRFSQIVEELGGFRQIGKVIPLIQQFATAQEALKIAQAGQGSLASDAVKAQLSLANQITKVREEFLSLIRSLGQSDTFQTLAKGALGFASGLIKISGALKGVLPALAILTAGAGLRALSQFTGGFVGGLKKVPQGGGGGAGGSQSISGAIGQNLGSTLVGAKTEQVSRDLDQNSAALDKVSGKLDSLGANIGKLDGSINVLNSNFTTINNTLVTYNSLLQQSISSLSTNTSSLDNLTNAVNNLNLGGGPTTARDGGKILGFNKGGVVPGSGKGDKVPAMLEPGEVVMNNSAADKYGRGNLVRMNKFARGSKVVDSVGSLRSKKGGSRIKLGIIEELQASDEVETTIIPEPITLNQNDFDQLLSFIKQDYISNIKQYRRISKNNESFDQNLRDTPKSLFAQKNLDPETLDLPLPRPPASWAKGNAFQRLLTKKYGLSSPYSVNKDSSFAEIVKEHFAPLDFESGDAKFEKGVFKYFSDKQGYDKTILVKRLVNDQDKLPWTNSVDLFTSNDQGKGPLENTSVYYPEDPSQTKSNFDKYYENKFNEEIIKNANNTNIPIADIIRARSLNSGGKIQRFTSGGVAELARTKGKSIEEILLEQIKALGGPAGVKRIIGVSEGDRSFSSLLNGNNIKAGKNIDRATKVVNEALDKAGTVDAIETKRIAELKNVAVAGLMPIGYSNTFEWDIGNDRSVFAYVKGFSNKYISAVEQMQQEANDISTRFAENLQYAEIFSGTEKLAFDFDDTLISGADILDESGKPDIFQYNNREAVQKALRKGRLTRLGQKLKSIIDIDPNFIKQTRILTARPQSTADLLSDTLNRFGLQYSPSDITGISTGLETDIPTGKASNLTDSEKLIDDSLANINAAKKIGKKGFLYSEPKTATSEFSEKFGQGNIEGAILEKTIAQLLGYELNLDKLESNRAVDFPEGLGRAAQFFDLNPNVPTEIKRTLNNDSFARAREEFGRYYDENPDKFKFNSGELVQNFKEGSTDGVKDRSTKNLVRGARGDNIVWKGMKVPLSYEDIMGLSTEDMIAYGRSQEFDDYVFSGGAGIATKKLIKLPDGLTQEEIEAFGSDIIKKADGYYSEIEEIYKFRKAKNLTSPASSMREARTLAAMEAEKGNRFYTQAEEAIASFKKSGILSPFDPSIDSHIQSSFPRYISSLESQLKTETDPDEKNSIQRKLKKAQAGWPDYQALLKGNPVPNQGRITGLSETLNTLLESYGSPVSSKEIDSIISALGSKLMKKNIGGIIQSFKRGGNPSRYVDWESGVGPSPFDESLAPKLDYYSILENSGLNLKSWMIDSLADRARTNRWTPEQIIAEASRSQASSQQNLSSTMDRESLLSSLGARPEVSEKQRKLAQSLIGPVDARYDPKYDNARRGFAIGGLAEDKKQKEFGKIALRSSRRIQATYIKDEKLARSGQVIADKIKSNLYAVQSSSVSKGYGPKLYDIVMEAATEDGSMLTSDRRTVSSDAMNVWKYYFNNRSDVKKTPLDPEDWVTNNRLLDPKLYGPPETWPSPTDPAWVLQSGYSKSPSLINDASLVERLASGGKASKFSSGGTIPALVSNGEAYVPPKTAKSIGYGTLNRMNQADRNGMGRFSEGGISVFKGPGTGTSDSIPTNLPVGSFIVRAKATKALGLNKGGSVGIQRFAFGGTADDRDLVASRAKAKGISFSAEVAQMRKALIDSAKELMNPAEKQNTLRILALENKSRLQAINDKKKADLDAIKAEYQVQKRKIDADTSLSAVEKKTKKKELSESTAKKGLDVKDSAKTQTEAIQNVLIEQIRSIDPRLASDELQNLSKQIISGFNNGLDLNNIITSSNELQKVFYGTINATDAQKIAAQKLAQQLGITEAAASSLANDGLIAASQAYDENLRSLSKMSSYLAKSSLAIGAFATGLAGAMKMFGGENDRGSVTTAAGIEGFGSTISILGAALSQLPGTIDSVIKGMQSMGGGIGNLATSIGPKIMTFMSNPFTAAAAVIGVAAVGIAAGFKEAHNAAREFDKQLASKNVENAMSKVSQAFEDFSKDMKRLDLLDTIKNELAIAGASVAAGIRIDAEVPKAMWVNLFDALGGGAEAAQRSTILEKQGIGAYLSTLSMVSGQNDANRNRNFYMQRMAPEMAKEQASQFKPVADQTLRLFEEKLRSGTSMSDVMGELKDAGGAPTQLAENIARSNPVIQEQILRIRASNNLSDEQKAAMERNIVAQEAEYRARTNLETVLRSMEIDKLNRGMRNFVVSLEKMFNNFSQSLNKASFETDRMADAAALSQQALTGNSKAGEVFLKNINVLQNPDVYGVRDTERATSQAAEFFGSQSGIVKPLITLGNKLETTVLKAINKSIEANPDATNEKIASDIRFALDSNLRNLGLPDNIVDKLSIEVGKAFEDLRKEGADGTEINFDELAEKVPALSKAVSSARRAQEEAIKALEFYQKQLNGYANSMDGIVELQFEANRRLARSMDILNDGALTLAQTLGKEIPLRETVNNILNKTSRQTGGLTDPVDITRNILNLEAGRQTLKEASDGAADRGIGGKDEFMIMQNRLKNTNLALRQNYDALKNLAESGEIASAALAKIQEIQQKRQAGVNLIEKLVTSSPEELAKLNNAIGRLNNNMMGIANIGSTSEQRAESLQAFNMLAPLLGEGQQQNVLKANVLESMLLESGMGVSPMFADILDSLRNPEGDPQMAEAIAIYNRGLDLQSSANQSLGRIQQLIADNNAEAAALKLKEAITGATLNFDQTMLKEINNGIQKLVGLQGGEAKDAAPMMVGGVVYASGGKQINFQPKGTDTVPAMLTPGEFVVNRSATRDNLPLLQNINSGNYNKGGKVKYYADGGLVIGDRWANPDKMIQDTDRRTETTKQTKAIFPYPKDLIGANKYIEPQNNTELLNYFKNTNKTIQQIPANYIAINKSAGDVGTADRLKPSFTPSVDVVPGWGYDSISVMAGGPSAYGSLNSILQIDNKNPNNFDLNTGRINPINVPDIIPDKLSQFAITESKINLVKKNYDNLYNYYKHLEDLKTQVDSSKQPTIVPNIKPATTRLGTGAGRFITISNLNKKGSDDEFFYSSDESFKNNTAPNMYGFRQDIMSFGTGAYMNVGFGGAIPFLGNMLETMPVADISNMVNPGNINNYGSLLGEKTVRFTSDNLANQNVITGKNLVSNFKSKLLMLQNNPKIEESKNLTRIKNYLAKLEALYNNNILMGSFEKGSPFDFDEPAADFPITLFNENFGKHWDALKTNYPQYDAELSNPFIGITKDGQAKRFPWISSGFTGDMSIFQDFAKEKGIEVVKLVNRKTEPFGNEQGRFFFPYEQVNAKLYDNTIKDFVGEPLDYVVVKQGLAESYDDNFPLRPLTNLNSIYAKDIDTLKNLLEATTPSYNRETGEVNNPANAYKYRLDGTTVGLISALNDSDFNDTIKALAPEDKSVLLKNKNNNPDIRAEDFFAEKFKKLREEKVDKFKTGSESDKAKKQFKVKLEEDDKLTNAKKVGIARAVYDIGRGVVGLRSRKPTNINDVGSLVKELSDRATRLSKNTNQPAPNQRVNNPSWLVNDAYRAFFAEMFKSKDDTASFIKGLGIPINNRDFTDPATAPKVPVAGISGQTEAAYVDYKARDKVDRAIKNIINREMALKSMKTFAGSLREEDKEALKLSGVKSRIYKGDSDTRVTDDEIVPKDYKDVFEIGLNPRNVFPDQNFRTDKYLNVLDKVYKNGTNAQGQLIFNVGDPTVLTAGKSLDILKTWYKTHQDRLLNFGLDEEQLQANRTSLGDGEAKEESKKLYDASQEAHSFLTGNSMGMLPDSAQLGNMISLELSEYRDRAIEAQNADVRLAKGGKVPLYASNGTLVNYQPRGTDTVPAMLTPGEFVVNRSATQANLPLLQSINSGNYASGGVVYAQRGQKISKNQTGPRNIDQTNSQLLNLNNNLLSLKNITTSLFNITRTLLTQIKRELEKSNNFLSIIALASVNELKDKDFANLDFDLNSKLNNVFKVIATRIQRQDLSLVNTNRPRPVIYASKGTLVDYQPRGTDTVPAMLTPGEFVVNRAATQANLPLLQSINSGNYASGGIVYLAGGGRATPEEMRESERRADEMNRRFERERAGQIDTRIQELGRNRGRTPEETQEYQRLALERAREAGSRTQQEKELRFRRGQYQRYGDIRTSQEIADDASGSTSITSANNLRDLNTIIIGEAAEIQDIEERSRIIAADVSPVEYENAFNLDDVDRMADMFPFIPLPSSEARRQIMQEAAAREATDIPVTATSTTLPSSAPPVPPTNEQSVVAGSQPSTTSPEDIKKQEELGTMAAAAAWEASDGFTKWLDSQKIDPKGLSKSQRDKLFEESQIPETIAKRVRDELRVKALEDPNRFAANFGFKNADEAASSGFDIDKLVEMSTYPKETLFTAKRDSLGLKARELFNKTVKDYVKESNTNLQNLQEGESASINIVDPGYKTRIPTTLRRSETLDPNDTNLTTRTNLGVSQQTGSLTTRLDSVKNIEEAKRELEETKRVAGLTISTEQEAKKGNNWVTDLGIYLVNKASNVGDDRERAKYTLDLMKRGMSMQEAEMIAAKEFGNTFQQSDAAVALAEKAIRDAERQLDRLATNQTTGQDLDEKSITRRGTEVEGIRETNRSIRADAVGTSSADRARALEKTDASAKAASDDLVTGSVVAASVLTGTALPGLMVSAAGRGAQVYQGDKTVEEAGLQFVGDALLSAGAGQVGALPGKGGVAARAAKKTGEVVNEASRRLTGWWRPSSTGRGFSRKAYEKALEIARGSAAREGENFASLAFRNNPVPPRIQQQIIRPPQTTSRLTQDPGWLLRASKGLSTGGLVYADKGTLVPYQPKGTDTVPAMLTPGEFVINRQSTQKYKPVLEAINSGNYSRGGIVNYLKQGGYIAPRYFQEAGSVAPKNAIESFDFTGYLNNMVGQITSSITQAFEKATGSLKQPNNSSAGVSNNTADLANIDNFVNRLNNIANILSNIYIPPQITITGKHDVVVTINGDATLQQLEPNIKQIVMGEINRAMNNLKANNPQSNIQFDGNGSNFSGQV